MNLFAGLFATFCGLVVWLVSIVIIAAVAYFVIKKAVKDALREHEQESSIHKGDVNL